MPQTNGSRGPLLLIRGGQSKMMGLTCSNIDLDSKLKRIIAIIQHSVLISQSKAWGPGRHNLRISQEIYWKHMSLLLPRGLDKLFLKSAWQFTLTHITHVTPHTALPHRQQGNGHHSHGIWPRLNGKLGANLGSCPRLSLPVWRTATGWRKRPLWSHSPESLLRIDSSRWENFPEAE